MDVSTSTNIIKVDWSGVRVRVGCWLILLALLTFLTFNGRHLISYGLYFVFVAFFVLFLFVQYLSSRTIVNEQFVSGLNFYGKTIIYWSESPTVLNTKGSLSITSGKKVIYLEKNYYLNFDSMNSFILNILKKMDTSTIVDTVVVNQKTRWRVVSLISRAINIIWLGYFIVGMLKGRIFIPASLFNWSSGQYFSGHAAWFLLGFVVSLWLCTQVLATRIYSLQKRSQRIVATVLIIVYLSVLFYGFKNSPTHSPVYAPVVMNPMPDK